MTSTLRWGARPRALLAGASLSCLLALSATRAHALVPVQPASAPTVLTVVPGNVQATVTLVAPADKGGGTISG